ncbi:MAG: YabP/YqfC family sporulation protein [Clostridia bacterium]|nr:YabP/YqfC family sporulation protein [Clostridia bacterium]
MRLYDEIFKNVDGAALARCIIVPRGGGYFEGVKSVADFSDNKLTLAFPRQTVEIEGRGLCIKKYCDGDLQLSGEILSLRVLLPNAEQAPTLAGEKKGDV